MEEEKLVAKIAELQNRLVEVRKSKKMEEDSEILKSFRSMELGTWDLYNLSTGIMDGEISMEALRQVMAVGGKERGDGVIEESTPDGYEEHVPGAEGAAPKSRRGRRRKASMDEESEEKEVDVKDETDAGDFPAGEESENEE